MKRIWKGLVLLLLFIVLLAACGGEKLRFTGLVTELQVDGSGALTGFVVETYEKKEVGVLLTDETHTYHGESGSWTLEELRAAFQAELMPDTEVIADCAQGKKVLIKDNGEQIEAYEADYISITGRLNRNALTVRDGTPIDVVEGVGSPERTYRLADGTALLRVSSPCGPENSYVIGVEGLDSLNEMVQSKILSYYEQRGLLYDEREELEKVYSLYRELGEDFHSGLVEQSVSPTASGDRVMYFLTTVSLPAGYENGNIINEIRLGDAFDMETGEHIDTWDLFAVPKDAAIKAILDESGVNEQPLRAEMEAASWDGRIVFFSDSLEVSFEPGALPSQEYSTGLLGVDLDESIRSLMYDWAVPKIPD